MLRHSLFAGKSVNRDNTVWLPGTAERQQKRRACISLTGVNPALRLYWCVSASGKTDRTGFIILECDE